MQSRSPKINPFFIVYKPRSGSTLLSDLVVRHKKICITPESELVPKLLDWSNNAERKIRTKRQLKELLDKVVFTERKFRYWGLTKESVFQNFKDSLPACVSSLAKTLMLMYARENNNSDVSVVGIKKGSYRFRYGTISNIFPSSKFIQIVRDGRAVYCSSKSARHSITKKRFERRSFKSSANWKKTIRIFNDFSSRIPHRVLEVKYENLISNTRNVLREVFDFLDVSAQKPTLESCLSVKKPAYDYFDPRGNLHENVGRTIDESRIDAWKNELSYSEICIFESLSAPELKQKNYEIHANLSNVYVLFGSLIYYFYTFMSHALSLKNRIKSFFDNKKL